MNKTYINIGTEKCCLFVKISMFLIKRLNETPFLYYAIEEALECAKNKYYVAGILTFSQLLNLLNEPTPKGRHIVAHKILKNRPTKQIYEDIKKKFEDKASQINSNEILKANDFERYTSEVWNNWQELIKKLNPTVNVSDLIPQLKR